MIKHIIFFDIDGTLLLTHGAGRAAFRDTLKTVFGWEDDIAYINFFGATDLDVLDQIFRHHDARLTATDADRFFAEMPRQLQARIDEWGVNVFPGVADLLHALSARADVRVGIVTGNIETCARVKLEAAGLHEHFMLGAFGHEHADRREIARLARRRAEAELDDPRAVDWVLLGDTPSDVMAAHIINARAFAVATGSHPSPELLECGADVVMDDLSDTNLLLRLLLRADR